MCISLNPDGRGAQGGPFSPRKWLAFAALTMLCDGSMVFAQQQKASKPTDRLASRAATAPALSEPAEASNPAQQEWKRQSDELLLLATQLKQEVDKTTENILSMKVIETAKQIERYTHETEQQLKAEK